MADVEKVKLGIKNCTDKKNKNPCESCEYRRKQGCTSYWMKDALSVIEEQQAEIEQMKAQKRKWLQNIADQQLAVSPTGYESEEGLAKRTGEWNGLQMAWEILTKE